MEHNNAERISPLSLAILTLAKWGREASEAPNEEAVDEDTQKKSRP